jgi:hypothetical protein
MSYTPPGPAIAYNGTGLTGGDSGESFSYEHPLFGAGGGLLP